MDKRIYIAGIGPGAREFVSPAAARLIESCDVLIGGKRNLEAFPEIDADKIEIGNNLKEIHSYIVQNAGSKRIAVLVTGDPGIYSIMEFLNSRLTDVEITVLPGISSLQYLCSKLRLSWNDMCITSLHGRQQDDLISIVKNNKKTAVYTGGKSRPEDICEMLVKNGLTGAAVSVGENLSYPQERVVRGTPEELKNMKFGSLSLMIVENDSALSRKDVWNYKTPGLPDDMFIRDDVPMTKEEVRAVSLAKLRLEENSVVYDIGAGTGSVSIECALMCPGGSIYAIEKNSWAVELLLKNVEKFNAFNITAIKGEAPKLSTGLPEPDRVFIGGTGGSMEEILGWIKGFKKGARVVINAVTVESAYEAVTNMEKQGFNNVEIVNISVSRGIKAGAKHLMQALNPVYVISGEKDSY